MTAKWLVPLMGYVAVVGALGVTGKLALRTLRWQDLVFWAGAAYVLVAILMFAIGQVHLTWGGDTWWAIVSAFIVPVSLILLYLALGNGDASKISPVSASYPAITLILAALFLSEHVSLARIGGTAVIFAGVLIVSLAK